MMISENNFERNNKKSPNTTPNVAGRFAFRRSTLLLHLDEVEIRNFDSFKDSIEFFYGHW